MSEIDRHYPIYLDCAATTPLDPEVEDVLLYYLRTEFGNAGSRTHEYGTRAKQAVQNARQQISEVVACQPDEVIFTSGATESNNLAILGLRKYGEETGRKHIISTAIEHKAVLEPLDYLKKEWGFEIDYISPNQSGAIDSAEIEKRLRNDTLLVSVMHVNNETGIIQPVKEIADSLINSPVFFHVDAAQGFGKLINELQHPRLDLVSMSGHKICGPKGVGALITRRRNYKRVPLQPLFYGGAQEKGLRPGTLPVGLIAALGRAAELANANLENRKLHYKKIQDTLSKAVKSSNGIIIGSLEQNCGYILGVSFPGFDSEALMLSIKEYFSVSNGAACTSQRYVNSHVLSTMHISELVQEGFIRLSWCHITPVFTSDKFVSAISGLFIADKPQNASNAI